MKLATKLHLEILKGKELTEKMEAHGWKRCKYNNEFNKGVLNAYFYYPFLIFNFTAPQNEILKKHFHKIAVFDYKIIQGHDHFKNKPLWQVVGIKNDYIGEWNATEKEALKELKDVAAS